MVTVTVVTGTGEAQNVFNTIKINKHVLKIIKNTFYKSCWLPNPNNNLINLSIKSECLRVGFRGLRALDLPKM